MDEAVILVGTETGTAEDVADELAEVLAQAGVEAEIADLEGAEPDVLDGRRAVVVCTATHGDGELPDDSVEFYEALEQQRPNLAGVLFAVCGLGDSVYPDFCEGGRIWSRLLAQLGAWEVAERHEIDGPPENEDVEGAREWAERVAERFTELARDG